MRATATIKTKKSAQAPYNNPKAEQVRYGVSKLSTGQEIQDGIFRRMSADKKIELGSALWELAREIAPDKMTYETAKSKTRSYCRDRNS